MYRGSVYQKLILPSAQLALPGRMEPLVTADKHFVSGLALKSPFRQGTEQVLLGMGCFWGAERHFWQQKGIEVTAVGYAGGVTRNPTYEEVCSGQTAHTEVVLVVFDPQQITFEYVLKHFWENPQEGPVHFCGDYFAGPSTGGALYTGMECTQRLLETHLKP